MAGLQYQIGADVKGFQQGVTQVTQGFNKLEQASGRAFKNIQTNANAGAQALNSVSQVARDLPFGFIAIQNNLPIVIDQFGSLVKTSGGVGGALKSLGAALIGPAGLTFAIGAVIATVTSLIQKYGSLDAAIDAIFFSTDRLAQESAALAEIQKEATKEAGTEIARLTVLNTVATDTTNNLKNRKEAANELLKVYKEYLPNVTQEAILNNQAADAINRAKDALIAKAFAAASEKKLAEIAGNILDLQLKKNDADAKALRISKQITEQQSKRQKIAGQPSLNTQTTTQSGLLNVVSDDIAGINEELKVQEQLFESVTKFAQDYAKKAGDGFIPDPKTVKPKVDNFAKELQKTLDKLRIDALVFAGGELDQQFQLTAPVQLEIKPPTREEIDNATAGLVEQFKPIPIQIDIPENDAATTKLLERLKLIREETKRFSEELTATLKGGLTDLFTSVAEGVGSILAGIGNGFSFAQTVLSSLADILINVGKLAIQTGVAILGIKKALQNLNPAVAIAGGVALVALGTAVKGRLANSVPKFAEGGIVTRPTAGIFGEAGPEAVMPLDKLNSMINNMGGGGNVNVTGEFALRGDVLYASVQRTQQRQRRVY